MRNDVPYEVIYGYVINEVILDWITFYNTVKVHYDLKGRTPNNIDKRTLSADMMNTPDSLHTYSQAKQKQGLILNVLAA